MPNNKGAKSPPPKKAKVDDAKVKDETIEEAKMTEEGEVPAEEEFFEVVKPAASPAKKGEGLKTLIAPSAMANMSGKKKAPSKVLLGIYVIYKVGALLVLDKGDKPDVYPEKYLKDMVTGNIQIDGLQEFLSRYGFLGEVSFKITLL